MILLINTYSSYGTFRTAPPLFMLAYTKKKIKPIVPMELLNKNGFMVPKSGGYQTKNLN
jgi:hypothetical protein